MNKLLDIMFIKRFCLPFDSDITSYEEGKCNITYCGCGCGPYNHVSCIIKKTRILSVGVNLMGDDKNKGIHAESDAISKLIPLRNKKRLKSVNLLVIRVSTKNKIQSSKPCNICIEMMINLPPKLGYKIQHVYYSNADGNIIKTNLKSLDAEEKHYSRCNR
jgi:cytidine deaminase